MSRGFPLTARPFSVTASLHSSPSSSGSSLAVPSGPAERMKRRRPSVSVSVLSVNSTSTFPRSSMQTRRLTSTLRRASCRDPAARLVETTAGSSWGEIPTAMASENSSASITGLCKPTLMMKIALVRTPATWTSSIENFRSPTWNSVSGCHSPSPRAIRPNSASPPVATTTPVPDLHDGAHQRTAAQLGQRRPGGDRFR